MTSSLDLAYLLQRRPRRCRPAHWVTVDAYNVVWAAEGDLTFRRFHESREYEWRIKRGETDLPLKRHWETPQHPNEDRRERLAGQPRGLRVRTSSVFKEGPHGR